MTIRQDLIKERNVLNGVFKRAVAKDPEIASIVMNMINRIDTLLAMTEEDHKLVYQLLIWERDEADRIAQAPSAGDLVPLMQKRPRAMHIASNLFFRPGTDK